ncbi:MAG: hypothetical protein R6U36_01315 [Candidatus Fermentibacteraceae bacterium]
MSPAVAVVAIVVVVGGVIWIAFHLERRRREAWKSVALRLGADFEAKGSDLHRRFPFQLFGHGSRRRTRNHVWWESDGAVVHMADYHYTTRRYTGKGTSSQTHSQTVCLVESPELDVPRTFLRRELGVLDWAGEKLGAQDIDFPEDEEFSKAFVMKGDEVRTRQTMTPELRRHLLQHRKAFSTLEMGQGAVMMNFGRKRKPEQFKEMVSLAMQVYRVVATGGSVW